MSLSVLPVEILRKIGHYIPEWPVLGLSQKADVTAVHGLTVSCTYFYSVFKPYLYRDIYTGRTDLFLLARSFKEDSSLASLVNTFAIGRNNEFDSGKAYTLVKKLRVLPKSCKRHLHPADTETIKLLLLESILIALRQIRKLNINAQAIDGPNELFDYRRWKAPPPNILPHLEYLDIMTHPMDGSRPKYKDLTKFKHLLALPRKLCVEVETTYLSMASHQFNFPRLESLDIDCESMTTTDFGRLVHVFSNLQSFTIHAKSHGPFDDDEWGSPQDYISLESIVAALGAEQPNLRTISIHLNKDEEIEWWYDGRDTLPDFRVFTKLRYLDTDFSNLWNMRNDDIDLPIATGAESEDPDLLKIEFLDKLPPSLEVLSIFLPDKRGLKEFNALAERKKSDFPRFRRLDLEMYDEIIGGPDPVPAELQKLFENLAVAGIEVETCPGPIID